MKEIIKYLLIFLSYFFYTIFITLIMYLFNIDISHSSQVIKSIYLFSSDLVYLIILLLLTRNDLKNEATDFKRNWAELVTKFFPIYILGIFLMGLSNSVVINITGNELSTNEETVRSMIKVYPIYMIFSSVIYAPIVEELIFRKSIRKIFNNDILFIIMSGTIFGLIHVIDNNQNYGLLMGIPYIVMGIDFAYIYYKSKNIFTTMSIHSFHNFILMIIQLIGG